MRTSVRIVVVGDSEVGKTSLISTLVSEHFPEKRLRSVLHEVQIAPDVTPDKIPLIIVDTQSPRISSDHPQDRVVVNNVFAAMRKADVVVLVYDVDRNSTFLNVTKEWLPRIKRKLKDIPVVIVGNKIDLRNNKGNLAQNEQAMQSKFVPILQSFKMVEACLECSAKNLLNIQQVFYFASKAVIYPVKPLFDMSRMALRPAFERALSRIFRIFDQDRDGVLSDKELNHFQTTCFNARLQAADIAGVKKVLLSENKASVGEGTGTGVRGITHAGFLGLNRMFINRSRSETSWMVMRHFHYNDDLVLEVPSSIYDDIGPVTLEQSCELTGKSRQFFLELFEQFDGGKGFLTHDDLRKIFQICPPDKNSNTIIPWSNEGFPQRTVTNARGHVTLDGWLAQWSRTTLLDPNLTLMYLYFLGYNLPNEDMSDGIKVTRRRYGEWKKNRIQRNTLRAFVFGASGVGKSALIRRLLAKNFEGDIQPTRWPQHSVGTNIMLNDSSKRMRRGTGNSLKGGNTLKGKSEPLNLVLTEWPSLEVERAMNGTSSTVVNEKNENGVLKKSQKIMGRRRLQQTLSQSFGAEHQGHLSRCDVAVLVFEPNNEQSFEFVQKLQQLLPEHVPVVFVVTKWDMKPAGYVNSVQWRKIVRHLKLFNLPLKMQKRDGGPLVPVELPVPYSSCDENPFKPRKLYQQILEVARAPKLYCPVGEAQRRAEERQRKIVKGAKITLAGCLVAAAIYFFMKWKKKKA
eukprot:g3703.t1